MISFQRAGDRFAALGLIRIWLSVKKEGMPDELTFNPGYAIDIYCGLKNLATTLISRFLSSTYF
jgi:hypothetical protein